MQAVVSSPDEQQRREYTVPSNTLRIRVGYPRTREAEADALVMMRDDVGLYFALGGSRALDKAADDLEDIRRRRQGRAGKISDPVVANIVRCQGIDAGRTNLRRIRGEYSVQEWDPARGRASRIPR